ncbi:MAG TPA: amidohydrolase family protein, partial [Longimicrobium sp.]|nr:amidohydrolase family protein [Longimicrobium sp.]
ALALAAAAHVDATAQASRGALAPGTFAVTHVTVVPMTGAGTVLRDATVLVRDGRIAAVGPAARVRVPAGARRIDGRGKFLVPGLADMHTHLFSDDSAMAHDSVAPYELGVMLANGVTATRLMIGTPEQLALRTAVAEGRVVGPQLWVASPQLAGRPYDNGIAVTTPEEARAAVRRVAAEGYDFVKLTLFIPPDVYEAVMDEAARAGVRVVGHVDTRVGIERALAAGQPVEHLDAYFEAVLADSAPSRASLTQQGVFRLESWRSLDHVDDRKIAAIGGATARAPGWGKWTSPTLNVFNDAFAVGPAEAELRARPEWGMLPPRFRDSYLAGRARYWSAAAAEVRTPERRRRYVEVRNALAKAIADSGGKVLAGSDTPEWFHLYGWGLHRELEALVGAGLSPYQALEAATRNPAEFLGALSEWGTVEPGKRADLVLLAADPLADIRNTARIEGVSAGGRWLGRPALDAMIRDAAVRLGGSPGPVGGP